MIRLIGILIGLGFTVVVLWAFGWGAAAVVDQGYLVEETAEHEFHRAPKELHLASDGAFGKWDLQQLQRGYQVYKEVCSACHSIRHVAFRDLAQLGYSEAEVKGAAAQWTVPGIDPVTGEANTRPGTPTDYFPSPYANDVMAAAANNNAVPPDLSLMAKARHDGAAYVYSLLTGYQEQPAELLAEFPDAKTPTGLYYNPYFPNLNLAMPPPIAVDGQVTYADGTQATREQMAKDVAAFLTWTAEPSLVKRKQTGWAVLGFLIFATVLAWLAKKQVWAPVTPKRRKD
ncbi:MAG TPA: cytochrome c1 [Croceibacterium sp.]|nr:cytochrome c1 [Croceibacterium sp.]